MKIIEYGLFLTLVVLSSCATSGFHMGMTKTELVAYFNREPDFIEEDGTYVYGNIEAGRGCWRTFDFDSQNRVSQYTAMQASNRKPVSAKEQCDF